MEAAKKCGIPVRGYENSHFEDSKENPYHMSNTETFWLPTPNTQCSPSQQCAEHGFTCMLLRKR